MCRGDTAAVQSVWLSIVGIGANGWADLTANQRSAIESAHILIGGARHLALIPEIADQRRDTWPSPLTDAIETIRSYRGEPVCVLASGDPFWFGVGATLVRYIDPCEIQVWPQPSAFSLAAARMGWALQDIDCLSVHGRALTRVVPALHDGARLLILSWDGTTARALARLLIERDMPRSRLTVLEHMGGPNERRLAASAHAWGDRTTADLNTIALDCVADTHARPIATTAGRSDALFENDGQLTKREIRALVLALLAPGRGEHLWDIGAGSGAIGIEWMLANPTNTATAIEARAERQRHIEVNATRLGVPSLRRIHGSAPQVLDRLENPDAIFIGGGLATPGVLTRCLDALDGHEHGRLVATSVTVEGDSVLAEACRRHGGRLRRINVSRSEPLGAYLGWRALRPITIWLSRDDEVSRS